MKDRFPSAFVRVVSRNAHETASARVVSTTGFPLLAFLFCEVSAAPYLTLISFPS